MHAVRILLIITGLVSALSATAEQERNRGYESTAVSRISLTILPRVEIANVDDIQINVANRGQDALYTESVCIRGNGSSNYYVRAHTDNGSSDFSLRGSEDRELRFEVAYRADLDATMGEQLRANNPSRLQKAARVSSNCEGGDTAAFDLRFPAAELSSADAGDYTGQLTLTVITE